MLLSILFVHLYTMIKKKIKLKKKTGLDKMSKS